MAQDKPFVMPSGHDPHAIRYTIVCDNTVVPNPVVWGVPYPTRDAASSVVTDLERMKLHLRGEPEQAWSDIAKLSRCPNKALLPRFKNISAEIVPIPQDTHERHRRNPNATRVLGPDLSPSSPAVQTTERTDPGKPGRGGGKSPGGKKGLPGSRNGRKTAKAKKATKGKGNSRRTPKPAG